jgi:type IV pilus assembly protein PilA
MIVVTIIGILATLSSYGVRKYVAVSKSAEALSMVGAIAQAVRVAAGRETMSAEILAMGESSTNAGSKVTGSTSGQGKGKGKGNGGGATVIHGVPGLCGSSEPVPASLDSIKGKKYQPNIGVDYETGDEHTGWRCLAFSNEHPQYYQYRYRGGGNGPETENLPHGGSPKGLTKDHTSVVTAQGDVDGDGETSWFVLEGYIDTQLRVVKCPAIGQDRPEE